MKTLIIIGIATAAAWVWLVIKEVMERDEGGDSDWPDGGAA